MIFDTYQDYRDAWNNAYQKDPKIPLNIDIELASICNLRCPFCFYGEANWNHEMDKLSFDGKPKKRLMSTALATKIIDEAAELGVPALKFNWRGESTLHPDYSEILRYAADKIKEQREQVGDSDFKIRFQNPYFFDLLVNTNANCKDHAIDGLMVATKCMISLDSTIPEIYSKMRVNGRLERAIEVTKELIKRGHRNLWIRRVITQQNREEIFKRRVDEIFGGGGYKVSEHYCMDRGDNFHALNNPDQYDRTYCGYPSQRLMVAADGICYPCCVDTDGTMPVGNVYESSLKQIWNGDKMQNLRRQLKNNIFKSKICSRCESWMAYKAPQRLNVQDKEVLDVANGRG